MAKLFKLTAGAVITLTALYVAAGYWAVPAVVKSALSEQVEQNLHRGLTLESVVFNPWTWTLSMNGLEIEGASPEQPLLRLNELVVDISAETLQHMAPVVDKLHINGLHVLASLDDPDIRKLTIEEKDSPKDQPDAKESAGGMPSFAIYDIAVTDASLRITDKARALDQSITDINIGLPFVSTLARAKESAITPVLSFKINGTPVVAQGTSAPFDDTLETKLNMKIDGLEIAQFARLVPDLNSASLRLDSGKLSTDLNLIFRNASAKESGKTLLSGKLSLANIKAVQKIGMKVEDLATINNLDIALKELDLLDKEVNIQNVTIGTPVLNLVRTPKGIGPFTTEVKASPVKTSKKSTQESDWRISVENAKMVNGRIAWRDQTVRPQSSINLSRLNAEVKGFDSQALEKTATIHLSANILGGSVVADGALTPKTNLVDLTAHGKTLSTKAVAPYLREASGLDVSGNIGFNIKGRLTDNNITASGRLDTAGLSIREGKSPLLKSQAASVSLKSFDLNAHRIEVESVNLKNADISLIKSEQGLNLLNLGKSGDAKGNQQPEKQSAAADTNPWQWSLGKLRIEQSRIGFKDLTVSPVINTELTQIRAAVSDLASAGDKPASVDVSAHFANGTLGSKGTLLLSPMTADLETHVSKVSMAAISPVLLAYTGIGAKNGQIDTQGRLSLQNDIVGWQGNIGFQNFDIRDKKGSALMFWKNAALTGLDIRTSDPIHLVIDHAVIEQPGTKHTQAVRGIAGLAGAFASLAGKDKTVQKIEKFEGKMDRDIVLDNVRYVNGRFTANGVSAESLAGMLLMKLSDSIRFSKNASAKSTETKAKTAQ